MIEKTKKINYIITGFIFAFIILVIFLSVWVFILYPKIKEINIQKLETKNKITEYEKLKNKWITFSQFNELKKGYTTTAYNTSLFKKINESFFDTYFVNKKNNESFDTFFSKKVNEINKLESDDTIKKTQESYKNILPTYVENSYEDEKWVMTDFKFVTYIESLLHTFNLDISSKNINIWNLNVLPEYANLDTPLEATIFYIPYKFDITWKKADVLDFIYFLENVWSIKFDSDWNMEVQEDNFIKKSLLWFDNWKIFENQIIDIEKIQISDYIDSGLQDRPKTKNLIDYVKETQWNEKININIDVRFYVKGVPNYKVTDSIDKLEIRYNEIKEEYAKLKNNKDITQEDKLILDKGLSYMKELDSTIITIKQEKTDFNNAYKKVLEVNKLLDILQNILKK